MNNVSKCIGVMRSLRYAERDDAEEEYRKAMKMLALEFMEFGIYLARCNDNGPDDFMYNAGGAIAKVVISAKWMMNDMVPSGGDMGKEIMHKHETMEEDVDGTMHYGPATLRWARSQAATSVDSDSDSDGDMKPAAVKQRVVEIKEEVSSQSTYDSDKTVGISIDGVEEF